MDALTLGYVGVVAAFLALVLAVLALVKVAGVTSAVGTLAEAEKRRAQAAASAPPADQTGVKLTRVLGLEQEVNKLRAELAQLRQATAAKATSSLPPTASDAVAPAPPAPAPAPDFPPLFLMFDNDGTWYPGDVSEERRELSRFRAERTSEDEASIRLLTDGKEVDTILKSPDDYGSRAYVVTAVSGATDQRRQRPGRIARHGDGSWRLVTPIQVTIG